MGDWAWAEDVFTGGALPMLHDLDTDVGWAVIRAIVVFGGGVLAWIVSAITKHHPTAPHPLLELIGAGLRLLGDMALLFHKAHALDSYVGAGLCSIPALAILSLHGTDRPSYARWLRMLIGVFGIGGLVASLAVMDMSTYSFSASSGATALQIFLLLTDAAFACGLHTGSTGRCALYVTLALIRPVLHPMLGRAPVPVLFFQTTLLLYSGLLHAGVVRAKLGRLAAGGGVVRPLVLLLSVILTLAFKFQWRHPQWASWTALGLMGVWGVVWCIDRIGGGGI